MLSGCGTEREVETSLFSWFALCDLGDLVRRLMRRRIGERWPVTSARRTSFSLTSSRVMFQPIGMPIAQEW